ncbi:MAG: glycosyltransferase family 2 protein [Chloroflexota bacterium]
MERPFASVLIPTRNPGPRIRRVLDAVFAQDVDFAFEVVVVDSDSCAADVDIMRGYPIVFRQIQVSEFGHGRTRNHLGKLSQGRVLFYLSQDAEPSGPEWMRWLGKSLDDAAVAGVYARQIPQPDADPLIRFFLARTYTDQPARRHVAHAGAVGIDDIFFSNVSSALRRDVWERFPFRDVTMSEDQYWAHDVLKAGYDVLYQPAAQVFHSHNYSLRTLYRRNWQSGASLRGLIADPPGAIARRGVAYVATQAAYLLRNGRAHWLPYMLAYEATKAIAFSMGLRFGHQPF